MPRAIQPSDEQIWRRIQAAWGAPAAFWYDLVTKICLPLSTAVMSRGDEASERNVETSLSESATPGAGAFQLSADVNVLGDQLDVQRCHLHPTWSIFSVVIMKAERLSPQCLHCTSSLSFPKQMAPPQDRAPSQPITAQASFLSDSLSDCHFLYVLSFSSPLFFSLFIFFFSAAFAVLALDDPPGARSRGGSQWEFSVLSPEHQSSFVGVGVRTSLFPVLPPSLRAQEGRAEYREWQWD